MTNDLFISFQDINRSLVKQIEIEIEMMRLGVRQANQMVIRLVTEWHLVTQLSPWSQSNGLDHSISDHLNTKQVKIS